MVATYLSPDGQTINIADLGSFNAYAHRFFSPSYSFALSYNYWFNCAVSVASDLVAAQILLQFWTTWHPWVVSLVFWVFLVAVNATNVEAYGELGRANKLSIYQT
jgi:AAT family amino acid transporter